MPLRMAPPTRCGSANGNAAVATQGEQVRVIIPGVIVRDQKVTAIRNQAPHERIRLVQGYGMVRFPVVTEVLLPTANVFA